MLNPMALVQTIFRMTMVAQGSVKTTISAGAGGDVVGGTGRGVIPSPSKPGTINLRPMRHKVTPILRNTQNRRGKAKRLVSQL